jgi:hypothetical protein
MKGGQKSFIVVPINFFMPNMWWLIKFFVQKLANRELMDSQITFFQQPKEL